MTQLIFKIKKAGKGGRSEIELILDRQKLIAKNTDEILSTLDKFLKKNKIKLESLKDIKLKVNKKAGLTSKRITKTIIKALCLDL